MAKVEWDPAWDTGIEIIDAQHHYLLEQLNGLVVAPDPEDLEAEAYRALELLVEYVDFHFRLEEEYMDGTGYPGLAAHRAAHDHMRAQARDLARARNRFTGRDAVRVRDFLLNWLVGHLTTQDRAMAGYLKGYLIEKGWPELPGSRIADR